MPLIKMPWYSYTVSLYVPLLSLSMHYVFYSQSNNTLTSTQTDTRPAVKTVSLTHLFSSARVKACSL